MFRLFKTKEDTTPARMPLPTYYFAKTMVFLLGTTYLITQGRADICFKSLVTNNVYGLSCQPNQEGEIFDALNKNGSVVHTKYTDCSFTLAGDNFCQGKFMGPICTLSYELGIKVDENILQIIKETCRNTFGSSGDYLTIASWAGVGGIAVCLVSCAAYHIMKQEKHDAEEKQPLNPNDIVIIIKTAETPDDTTAPRLR